MNDLKEFAMGDARLRSGLGADAHHRRTGGRLPV
ncbi:hypothetical protein H4W31_006464 [Plantactinospora soyae]|uniref:Uncharacterized protein n=1 Tax=Plantactinospora soyae TaxID=1544732 RepID=A0A927MCX5_9ACTN|nr:hypothetical protein [Plantactinospora soyae]